MAYHPFQERQLAVLQAYLTGPALRPLRCALCLAPVATAAAADAVALPGESDGASHVNPHGAVHLVLKVARLHAATTAIFVGAPTVPQGTGGRAAGIFGR